MKNEESLFERLLGGSPTIRVIDFLLENKLFDYSKKDICRQTGVSWNTLQTFWSSLKENGIVVFTRKSGKADMFKLNPSNPVVKKLIELDNLLMKKSIERLPMQTEKMKILAKSRN
ncbi:MAG: hypothetical protein Q7S21_00865 [archaeon]|nr:hypothetical protein [archaeon]